MELLMVVLFAVSDFVSAASTSVSVHYGDNATFSWPLPASARGKLVKVVNPYGAPVLDWAPNCSVTTSHYYTTRVRSSCNDASRVTFTLLGVTWPDEGSYTCVSSSDAQIADCGQNLTLNKVPPKVQIELTIPDAVAMDTEGKYLTLTCVVTEASPSVPEDGYIWSYLPSPYGQLRSLVGKTSTLTLGPLTREDSGQYFCQASNDKDNRWKIPPVTASFALSTSCIDALLRSDISSQAVVEKDRHGYKAVFQLAQHPWLILVQHPNTSIITDWHPPCSFSVTAAFQHRVTNTSCDPCQATLSFTLVNVTTRDLGRYQCYAGSTHGTRIDSCSVELISKVPTQVHIEPVTPGAVVKAAKGDHLILTCVVTEAFPPVPEDGYSWSYLPSPQGRLRPVMVRSSTLTLGPLTREDSGQYLCQAWNDQDFRGAIPPGNASVTVDVSCGAGAGFLSSQNFHLEGSNVTLKCSLPVSKTLSAGDAVWYQWTRNGCEFRKTQSDSLTIYNASEHDEGVYTCKLSSLGKFTSNEQLSYGLVVVAPPVVSIPQRSGEGTLTVAEGGALALSCRVTNNPRPPVGDSGFNWTFRRQGALVEELLGIRGQEMSLQPVHRNQSGRYSCRAATDGDFFPGYRASTSSVLVLVQYLDSHVSLLPKEKQTLVEKEKVNLTCRADSVPTATLTWLHQGRVLRTVEGNEDVLSFPATGCQDSGELQCRADNAVLNTFSLAATGLDVECAPSVPGGSTQTRVSFRVGENVTLAVQVLANPAPTYTWSGPGLDGGHRSASLTLVSLETGHSGHYSVTVSNRLGSLVHAFLLTVQEQEGQAQRELKVGGGVAASLLCLLGLLCLLCCHRKRRLCRQVKGGNFVSHGQDRELEAPSRRHEAGRGGAREEGLGAHLGCGHGSGQFGDGTEDYCSIHSADVIWQPQPDPTLPSVTQDKLEHSYDVPPPAVRMKSSRTCVSRDKGPVTAVDVLATDDVTGDSPSDESQDSDSYLACHVVSQGLPYSSLTPHSPDPQTQYLTPHSPASQTQYLTPHSPDPHTQYLTPHSPDLQHRILTPLYVDMSGGRGGVSDDVSDYVVPELD